MRHRTLFAFAAFPALALFAAPASALPRQCLDGDCGPIERPIEIIDEPPLDPNPAPHPQYGYNNAPKPDACETIAPAESWMVGVKKAQDFGNNTFGAGYELFLGIEARRGLARGRRR